MISGKLLPKKLNLCFIRFWKEYAKNFSSFLNNHRHILEPYFSESTFLQVRQEQQISEQTKSLSLKSESEVKTILVKNLKKFCEMNQISIQRTILKNELVKVVWEFCQSQQIDSFEITTKPLPGDFLIEEEKQAKKEIEYVKGKLTYHFYASITENTTEFQKRLLSSIFHWTNNHEHCFDTAKCKRSRYFHHNPYITHPVAIVSLYHLWTSKRPGTNMSLEELKYFRKMLVTSKNECFHSFLIHWVPKAYYWKETYETRVFMAEMHWNENCTKKTTKLPQKKKKTAKGKRKRGMCVWKYEEEKTTRWFYEICLELSKQ